MVSLGLFIFKLSNFKLPGSQTSQDNCGSTHFSGISRPNVSQFWGMYHCQIWPSFWKLQTGAVESATVGSNIGPVSRPGSDQNRNNSCESFIMSVALARHLWFRLLFFLKSSCTDFQDLTKLMHHSCNSALYSLGNRTTYRSVEHQHTTFLGLSIAQNWKKSKYTNTVQRLRNVCQARLRSLWISEVLRKETWGKARFNSHTHFTICSVPTNSVWLLKQRPAKEFRALSISVSVCSLKDSWAPHLHESFTKEMIVVNMKCHLCHCALKNSCFLSHKLWHATLFPLPGGAATSFSSTFLFLIVVLCDTHTLNSSSGVLELWQARMRHHQKRYCNGKKMFDICFTLLDDLCY